MKAWITKYALTSGIFEAEGSVTRQGGFRGRPVQGGLDQYFYGADFHLTKEEAITRAEEMRVRKLQSLDKQIKKVSALKFE